MPRTAPSAAREGQSSPGLPWGRIGLAVGLVLILVVAFVVNAMIDQWLQGEAKKEQEKQQVQMQEALKKQQEDFQRRQISVDTRRKAEIESTLKQFQASLLYDVDQLNKTLYGYGAENLSDANLPLKVAAAKKYGVAVVEFASHVDGFKEYVGQTIEEANRLSRTSGGGNVTEAFKKLDETKAQFRQFAGLMRKDLEQFAGTNLPRQAAIAEAVMILKTAEGAA